MSPGEVAAICAAILAVAGVLGLAWKVVKAAYRVARRIELIEERSEQLVANSGTSLFDKVAHTHDTVLENSERIERVEEHQVDQDRKIARNQGRIEALALVTSPTMLIEDEEGKLRDARPPETAP